METDRPCGRSHSAGGRAPMPEGKDGGGGGGSQEVAESHGGVQAEAVRPRPLCQAEWAGGWPTK